MSLEVQVNCLLGKVETPLAPSDLNLPAEVRRVKVDWLEISDVTIEARSWEKKRKVNTKYSNKLYCQATGTGTGPGPGNWGWEMGMGKWKWENGK